MYFDFHLAHFLNMLTIELEEISVTLVLGIYFQHCYKNIYYSISIGKPKLVYIIYMILKEPLSLSVVVTEAFPAGKYVRVNYIIIVTLDLQYMI